MEKFGLAASLTGQKFQNGPRIAGRVRTYMSPHGFIDAEDVHDGVFSAETKKGGVYFDGRALRTAGLKYIVPGQEVSFELMETCRGWRAANIALEGEVISPASAGITTELLVVRWYNQTQMYGFACSADKLDTDDRSQDVFIHRDVVEVARLLYALQKGIVVEIGVGINPKRGNRIARWIALVDPERIPAPPSMNRGARIFAPHLGGGKARNA